MERIEQIIGAVDQWDRAVTLFINTHLTFPGDSFWMFMSGIKVWIPLYVAVAAMLMWRLGWKRGLIAIAFIALCFYCDERICNLIKMLVERVRPCNDEEMLAAGLRVLENGNNWSFPSGHACNTFGFAISSLICFRAEILGLGKKDTSFSLRKKRIPAGVRRWVALYGIMIILWAVLVGLSRIMVGRHFLLDVVTGSAIGILMGLLWGKLTLMLFSKINF